MNIGIDARMYGPNVGGGGLGRYVEQLVTQLQAIDHKNRYVLFLKPENFDTCIITNSNFEKRLVDIHWYTLKEQLKMGHIVDKEALDLVHFPHFNVPVFMRTPFIVTIHDLILFDEPFSTKISTRHKAIFAIKYQGYKHVLSHAAKKAEAIIAVSNTTAKSIKKHIPSVDPKRIHVVYEGVTPLPPKKTKDPIINFPYILYVGNAYPHKNLDQLLAAFDRMRATSPDLHLVLAGKPSIFYDRALNQNPKNVLFQNSPSDAELANLYENAHIYVYPSRIEGFGLPPLEAMSVGTPVAASRIPALVEVLDDAAAYFDPYNTEDIARVLTHLLQNKDERKNLIQKGTEKIKQYDWKKMALHIQSLYETCGKKRS